ncbi:alpha/beta hydrolase, partial [Cognatilysobacter lacus]
DDWNIPAPGVSATPLHVRVFATPGALRDRATLYVNDGQDADAVGLADTLASLARTGSIAAPVVVAIDMPPDRMGAYGFSDRAARRAIVAPTRYGVVGSRAQAYSEWLAHVLVPWVEARYPVRRGATSRALLGWSLGAANAFNVGWQYPDVFGRVGAFSPSLWLSTEPTDDASVQRTRIAQSMLARGAPRGLHLFLAVGTDEETSDRDGDGINDALDDVRELVDGSLSMPGLRQLGYRIEPDAPARHRGGDVVVYELPGGIHRQSSWARMLPAFLRWAYPRGATVSGVVRSASPADTPRRPVARRAHL